jgi:hypothetical protein
MPYIDVTNKQVVKLEDIAWERNVSIPAHPTPAQLAELGVGRLATNPKPGGDVVTEGVPQYDAVNDVWQQTWVVRKYTSGERIEQLNRVRKERREELTGRFYQVLSEGMPYTVNDETFTVQIRPEDQSNLIVLRLEASTLISIGEYETPMEFRTLENTSVVLTPEQMVDMTTHALGYIKDQYKILWALKDQLEQETAIDAVRAIAWPEPTEV